MTAPVPFREALRAWARVAALSFGGPAAQIAVIHRVAVEEKKWIDESAFVRALSFCMLLPGPEAQQLATYVGWKLHGLRGGLAAGLLFVLPGFIAMLVLSVLYVSASDVAFVAALFFGLKPAVLPVVLEAVARLKRRAAGGALGTAIAAVAFVAIFAFGVPFPVIVAGAALVGFLAHRDVADRSSSPSHGLRTAEVARSARDGLTWLAIWLVPVAALFLALGPDHVLARQAAFFSRVAVVTFGGAYAVLAYVAQQAVEVFNWLSPTEMLDGLGLAETTPGPLIMVVQFVAFLGAYRNPGTMDPDRRWNRGLDCHGVGDVCAITHVHFCRRAVGRAHHGEPAPRRGFVRCDGRRGGRRAQPRHLVRDPHAVHRSVDAIVRTDPDTRVRRLASFSPVVAVIAMLAAVALFRFRLGLLWVLAGGALLGVVAKLSGVA